MDRPIALSRFRCREWRLNNYVINIVTMNYCDVMLHIHLYSPFMVEGMLQLRRTNNVFGCYS